ncbi:MAG: CPBP family intramembrane metalloprotease [Phycisphaerae bacterium]|nr:CPBP family intramembrane metalloprotease [Phycisphaerae bacterium]
MPDDEVVPADETTPSALRAAWIEIGVVLAVGVFPHLVRAIVSFEESEEMPWPGPMSMWVSHSVTSLCIAAPVLYVMAKSGKPWAHFGLTRVRPAINLSVAGALFLITMILSQATWGVLHRVMSLADYAEDPSPAGSILDTANPVLYVAVFVVAMAANAFAEELTIRGFLIPRLLDVGWNRVAAVAMPTFLFASYHLYQGVAPVIVIAVSALVESALFLVVRRLWPFVLAHLALNLFNSF